MKWYKFEVVQTVDGFPDPCSYPEGLSDNPRWSGAAMVVYGQYENKEDAERQFTIENSNPDSDIYWRFNPLHAGLDVFFIGPATDEEVKLMFEARNKVLYHSDDSDEGITPEIYEMVSGSKYPEKPLPKPSAGDHAFFFREVNEAVYEIYEEQSKKISLEENLLEK